MKSTHIANCKFCGQPLMIEMSEDSSKQQITEAVTMLCECDEAILYRKPARASQIIEELCGAGVMDFDPVDKEAVLYMKEGCGLIASGLIDSMQFIVNGDKVTLSDKGGVIVVTRQHIHKKSAV